MSGKPEDEIMGDLLHEWKSLDSRFDLERIYYYFDRQHSFTNYARNPETGLWHGGMTFNFDNEWLMAIRQIAVRQHQ